VGAVNRDTQMRAPTVRPLASCVPNMASDTLTAGIDQIEVRDSRGSPTLGDCWRAFLRYTSPKLIAAAVVAAGGVRIAIGNWSWRDLAVPLTLLALEPFTEWLIHVYLLHAKPIRLGGRRYDLLAAREHRAHHRAPGVLNGVLIPTYAIAIFLPQIALIATAVSFPAHAVLGGNQLAGAVTGLVGAYLILGAYEWCHFLIHTPYRPTGRYYKAIWRNHRLHHYKNEHYWFGVTSNFGDKVLGTDPDQATVTKSATARTLA
jgi:sterol desaturase/sphingolipid hydroxylase (fatty acid hydroxylase superfamily)